MKASYLFLTFIATLFACTLTAQTDTYILNGSASQDKCNCYTLTPETSFQSGSVWNKTKIDLRQSFDFTFNVFLGCQDKKGADGIVFILQNVSTNIGGSGGGMGFQGIYPAIGITLDTWQNNNTADPVEDQNDPAYDHISIQANGVVKHGNDLAGPVRASATSDNIEDCQWHLLRISWDAATHSLKAYFDGVLRVQAQSDLTANIFNNDPMVYWGFSAGSGGYYNLQQFCTALNPDFKTNLPGDTACQNAAITFKDASQSFAPVQSYFWDFGDGTTSHMPDPPAHTYAEPGWYTVKMAITGKDGCLSDTLSRTVTIGSVPVADFTIKDICFNTELKVSGIAGSTVGAVDKWEWQLNESPVSTEETMVLKDLRLGTNNVQLQATSEFGCLSRPVVKTFVVNPPPQIKAVVANGCVQEAVSFSLQQTDNATTIAQWFWDFGDNQFATTRNAKHTYKNPGQYKVQSWAISSKGCASEVGVEPVTIHASYANAGNDTIVLTNIPFQLNGRGNGAFKWFPADGLNNDGIPNPTGLLNNDQTYLLTVTSPEGCVAKDTIKVSVSKGTAVYVPNAFTPNGDGVNDRLKPLYIGIKQLHQFTIYNRWGQQVFATSNMSQQWNGWIQGQPAPAGTYVWMVKAEDILGHVYQLKGTITLIR